MGASLASGMGQDSDQYAANGDQDDASTPSGNRASVHEAADALGVTVDAIRKRIQRGTIPHERHEDGRVYVLLDAASTPRNTDQDEYQDKYRTHADALVESLGAQVEYLKGVVATRDEEIRRRDHIIAGLVERVPALEAPRNGHETPADDAGGGVEPRPPGEGPQEVPEPRSWWRRWFGFE